MVDYDMSVMCCRSIRSALDKLIKQSEQPCTCPALHPALSLLLLPLLLPARTLRLTSGSQASYGSHRSSFSLCDVSPAGALMPATWPGGIIRLRVCDLRWRQRRQRLAFIAHGL